MFFFFVAARGAPRTTQSSGWVGSDEYKGGTVRYGTVRYGTVRYGTVRYGTVRYGTVRYGTVRVPYPHLRSHETTEQSVWRPVL